MSFWFCCALLSPPLPLPEVFAAGITYINGIVHPPLGMIAARLQTLSGVRGGEPRMSVSQSATTAKIRIENSPPDPRGRRRVVYRPPIRPLATCATNSATMPTAAPIITRASGSETTISQR
jgi:hypothetical protein